MNASDRMAEVEIRLSFQDELLSTLNEVVTAQGFQIQHLTRLLDELRQTITHGGPEAAPSKPLDERPPHY
jgi:SlyX protein